MRYSFDGFFDRTQQPGNLRVTNTPGNHGAIEKYKQRQQRSSLVGTWRKGTSASWKHNSGSYIDPDYYIVDYGQEG